MPNPFFSGRIPQELLDHVEKHRESTGESKTDVLVKALTAYTGFEGDNTVAETLPKISELLERLEKLENRVFNNEVKSKSSETEKRQIDLFTTTQKAQNSPKTLKAEILTTQQVVDEKIASQSSLSNWKNKKLLPKAFKGNLIEFSYRDEELNTSFWKVTPV